MKYWQRVLLAAILPLTVAAGPTTAPASHGPSPRIESTGPLRVARYARAFAPPIAPDAAQAAAQARYYFATPTAYSGYGCGGYNGYCGWSCYGVGYGVGCGVGCFSLRPASTGVAPSGAYAPGW